MAEARKVRVGLLGLGSIAQVVHLPVLSQLDNVELVGVCDVDRGKARAIAARFGIPRVFQSDDEVFSSSDLDALVICTPNHLHETQAIAALQSGKHTLVEKPLAMTPEAAARVLAAADAAGRILQVAMNSRFRPDAQALKPFAAGGELGDLFLAQGAWLNRRMRLLRPTWRHRRSTAGGGALMDLGVQILDLAWWLLGFPRVASVSANTFQPPGMEVEDAATVMLRLAGGGCIWLSVSWSLVANRDAHSLRILGTRGSGTIAPLSVFKEFETGMIDVTPQLPVYRENPYTASYRNQLQDFLGGVLRGGSNAGPPTEQADLMRLVAVAYQAAAEKREVEVDGGDSVPLKAGI
ncbi:MAG: Gfo/Idh/MocA family oxidoreductase [Gemmatimonadetes bacterium]|nr:Gfo/Idh/MocA family oxidoreductase [Gemmatimonadota bacterium]